MRNFLSLVFVLCCVCTAQAQIKRTVEGVKVQTTFAEKLGTTAPLRDLIAKEHMSPEKKQLWKKNRAVPPNFKNRGGNSAIIPELEHQGEDPIWQKEQFKTRMMPNEPLVNVDGLRFAFAPPTDPTGAVGKDHYMQAVNATTIGIYTKEGNLLNTFTGNTLWGSIGFTSGGDPIVLYDHEFDRWVITEFPSGGSRNLLFGISLTDDPSGAYDVYNFETPQFPDYPKWGIWSNAYAVSTNEGGGGMKIYAINRAEMIAGEEMVNIQRIELPRPTGSEQGFLVATPVDWNGSIAPPQGEGPYYLKLEDSSWGTVAEDAVHVYGLDVDWDDSANSNLSFTEIVTTPYDAFPCASTTGGVFACVPQRNGVGLDGIPEVIMNTPKYRNFGSHESIVLNFITDATDGQNYAGIRWMELRKTAGENWSLYQEGTFAPEDGKERFMAGIGIAANGAIGMAYNFAGVDEFAGMAYTGRTDGDPLGVMTLEEVIVVEGQSTINSAGRFSDYSQLSVDPINGKTFWFTSSYANATASTNTRIIAFEMNRDTVDLQMSQIVSPKSQSNLTATEGLEVIVRNVGLDSVDKFKVGYIFQNGMEIVEDVDFLLKKDSSYMHRFTNTFDMSSLGAYDFTTFVTVQGDNSNFNDTLRQKIRNIASLDVAITDISNLEGVSCEPMRDIDVTFKNEGFDTLTSAEIVVMLNGVEDQVIPWTGNLAYLAEETIPISLVDNVQVGINNVIISIRQPNGMVDPIADNNMQGGEFEILGNTVTVTLELQLDFYAGETSWTLTDEAGNLIAEGGEYATSYDLVIESFCLDPEACYIFTIFDTYGDGLTSSGNADGSYVFYDEEGLELASIMEANFGSQEVNNFCATFECSLEAEAIGLSVSEEGAADGVLVIEVTSGSGPYSYSIDGGITFQSDNMFPGLEAGDYDFVVLGGGDCVFNGTGTIDVCMLTATFEVTPASSAGSADGSITINATNTTGDVEYSVLAGVEFQSSNFFPGLLNGTYPIVVRDESGCEFRASVNVDIVSSSDEETKLLGVEIYPNPTEGVFQVNLHGVQDAGTFIPISIYDMNGKRIQNSSLVRYDQTHTGQLSLYAYPSGTYFFKIHHKSIDRLYRVIKQD